MAAPVHVAVDSGKRRGLHRLTDWVSTKGCTHALKLRHSFKVDAHTRMELGMDYSLGGSDAPPAPWAAVLYQFDAADAGKGALELNPLFATWNRSWVVGKSWYEVPLDTKVGLTHEGGPHVEVGIGNVPLMLAAAAVLLATGKTIHVKRKEAGSLAVHFPLTNSKGATFDHTLQERVEVDASLRAEGRGLRLDLHQLNGVLRLRQD